MINPTITIRGREKVIARLSAFDVRVASKVEDTVIKYGQLIAKDAKKIAGFKDRTGLYRRSLKSKYFKNSYTAVISSFYKGRVSRIAHLLEFGTVKTKAYPHLSPALEMNVQTYEREIQAVARSAIGGA